MTKRLELFHELLYYIFDSLLIPLIAATFYVTESNTHRYQVFYFRHDVWRRIAEPALSILKKDMFQDIRPKEATDILDSRRLGFSQLRLLPKGQKLRPIMNLRRRQIGRNGCRALNPSINSVLGPVHTALKFEKVDAMCSPRIVLQSLIFTLRHNTHYGWGRRCSPSATCMQN